MSILDISKTLIYDFHYNYMKKTYGENCEVLMTVTYSLMYEINTDNFYRDMNDNLSEKFDTSNFQKYHPSGILTGINKKVLECSGTRLEEKSF